MIGKLTTFVALIALMKAYDDCNSYKPVCGSNQVTYQNACACNRAKVQVRHQGRCHRRTQYRPLSSYQWNNNVYGNSMWNQNTGRW